MCVGNNIYMADLYQQLAHIQTLTYTLVQKYEEALNENQALQQKINELDGELAAGREKLQTMEGELRTARMARGLDQGNGEDAGLAKAKISTLVREIDRCIALLNE